MRTALVGQGCLEKHADDPAIRQRFVAEAEINGGWSTQVGSDQRDVYPVNAISPLKIHRDA
jgi:hypothetical protein